MKNLLSILKKDDNALSLARVCALASFFIFVFATLWLVIRGEEWRHYSDLTYSAISFLCIALLNKTVEVGAGILKVKEGENNA